MNRSTLLAVVIVAVLAVATMWALWVWREPFASELPRAEYVVDLPGLLSPAQCDALVAAASARTLEPSEVGMGLLDASVRKSSQTWFSPGEHPVADALRTKASGIIASTGKFESYAFEAIQVARYGPGGKYDLHYDGDDCQPATCPTDQRLATLLVYLSEPPAGGETTFPLLGKTVRPKKGSAVFFRVADPRTRELYEKTLHAGRPVGSGTKWIANVWVRGV